MTGSSWTSSALGRAFAAVGAALVVIALFVPWQEHVSMRGGSSGEGLQHDAGTPGHGGHGGHDIGGHPGPAQHPAAAASSGPASPSPIAVSYQDPVTGCMRPRTYWPTGTAPRKARPYPVAVYWHVATLIEGSHWRTIVRDQYRTMLESGLLWEAEGGYGPDGGVRAVIVGDQTAGRDALRAMDPCGYLSVVDGGDDTRKYEFATLQHVEDYCTSHPTARVGYFHNKGSRYDLSTWAFYAAWCWRKFLEWYVIGPAWRGSVDVLEDGPEDGSGDAGHTAGYDTAGPNFYPSATGFYSGNFWWARCDHINRLPRLKTLDWSDRWIPEWWISMKPVGQDGQVLPHGSYRPYRHANCYCPWPKGDDMYQYEFPWKTVLNGTTNCAPPRQAVEAKERDPGGVWPPYPSASYERWREVLGLTDLSQYRPEYLPPDLYKQQQGR